jgi:hypothetical protein
LLRFKLLTPEKLLESGFQHFLAEIAKVEFSGLIQDLNRQSSKDSFHNPSFVLTEHPVSV